MTAQEELALTLFDIGAIMFGSFRLKLHEKDPDAPLSPIYVNLRTRKNPTPGPLTAEVVTQIGNQLLDRARGDRLQFDYLAGVPVAGEPLAYAFSATSRYAIPLLYLKKENTAAGRRITEVLNADIARKGNTILLIDDLITNAASKLEAIAVLEKKGFTVTDVLVLVDREQGGKKQLYDAGYTLHAVLQLSTLLAFYVHKQRIDEEKSAEVLSYIEENA